MAMETYGWEGADTDQNRMSNSVWGRCPWNALRQKRVGGVAFFEDFTSFGITPPTTEGNWMANNGWSMFSSTGGTVTAPALSAATKAGVPSNGITIGSDDDNEGVGLRTISVPFALNRANQKFWFEVCLKKSTIANTTFELFAGLMENTPCTATVPITTTAATLADKNLVGFYSTESAGSTGNTTYKADTVTAVTVGSAEVTFVADTYTKLGMKYEPYGDKAGAYILSFYQDGTRLSSTKQLPDSNGTDFPTDVALGLCIATRNAAGSSPGTATIKWIAAAQLYAPLN